MPTFRNTVPKRRHIKFRRRRITQKKACNIQTRRKFEIMICICFIQRVFVACSSPCNHKYQISYKYDQYFRSVNIRTCVLTCEVSYMLLDYVFVVKLSAVPNLCINPFFAVIWCIVLSDKSKVCIFIIMAGYPQWA